MHEYPITEQIIKIAEEHCQRHGGRAVKTIQMVVGAYSGFVPESIQMYFDIISEGSACQGAKLEIQRIEPKLKCRDCGKFFKRELYSFKCPYCGGEGGPTEIGKEFYVKSIEIR